MPGVLCWAVGSDSATCWCTPCDMCGEVRRRGSATIRYQRVTTVCPFLTADTETCLSRLYLSFYATCLFLAHVHIARPTGLTPHATIVAMCTKHAYLATSMPDSISSSLLHMDGCLLACICNPVISKRNCMCVHPHACVDMRPAGGCTWPAAPMRL